jgi:hypothetical protein
MSLLSSDSFGNEKKIYAWKDKNGILVFSDTPHAGAKEVKLMSQKLTMPSTNSDILYKPKVTPAAQYQVEITSPEHNKTIRENTGSVYVTSRIMPVFEQAFKVQLFLDDEAQGNAGDTSTFVLRDVNRGEHTLQIKVFNKNKIVAISKPHTFYMHRQGLKFGH